jgi:protein-S-isoprenylcysteine O-methyltransferase Ste14
VLNRVGDARRRGEHRLRARLGAPYEAYCRAVKRLIPFVW